MEINKYKYIISILLMVESKLTKLIFNKKNATKNKSKYGKQLYNYYLLRKILTWLYVCVFLIHLYNNILEYFAFYKLRLIKKWLCACNLSLVLIKKTCCYLKKISFNFKDKQVINSLFYLYYVIHSYQ